MNETMEIMKDEMDEVMFVAESITPKTNKGLKVVGVTAGVLAVGYGIYKGAKWIGGKIKAKKGQEEATENNEPTTEDIED